MTASHRKRKRYRWLRKAKRLFLTFFSPKTTLAEEQPVRKRKRRTRKKPLGRRIYLSCLKFAQNLVQWIQKLLSPKKRIRRRKRKQYAVYVMGNQKRVL
jgi:hypothetical protein